MKNERLGYLREKARALPLEPGVYIMRDHSGTIIYIGKAKALRNRVSSYFRSVYKHEPKVYRMVENAFDFDTILCQSEFEALVLECSMIKLHKPKYNILLKDDKGYHYIRVSPGPYPRITAELQRHPGDEGRFLGPYTSSFVVNNTVEEVNKAFMLPTCTRRFPEDLRKGRPCLNFHIKQCIGLCSGKIPQADYIETINQALEFIGAGSQKTLELLERQMQAAAENMEFEKAARYRDRMRAIERITQRQNVVFAKVDDLDAVALAQTAEASAAVVLKFRGQKLVDKQDFPLGEPGNLEAARAEFLLSAYGNSSAGEIPRTVALDGPCDDRELLERLMSEKAGRKVSVHVPERGEQLRLVKMAAANAAEMLAQKTERTGRELAALDELARLLGLEPPPNVIEAYDISNLGAGTVVGGMVVFEDGRPFKKGYRKFNIKSFSGTDDYAAMREVVSRRLARYESEKESGEGFGRLPDLILLDGGKGHVAAVKPLMAEMGFGNIPVFGMVKDDRHRTRAIAQDGGEIAIISTRSAFALVTKIQDEAHRFAITFMKQKHKKTSFELNLTQVPGIGGKRARELFRHFKTKKAMAAATREELAAAPGMTKTAAEKLYEWLHPQ